MRQIQLSYTEIGNFGVAVFCDQNVGRLDIPVYDALGVRVVQGFRKFFCQLQSLAQGQLLFAGKNTLQ